jgi:hypothetical protein
MLKLLLALLMREDSVQVIGRAAMIRSYTLQQVRHIGLKSA